MNDECKDEAVIFSTCSKACIDEPAQNYYLDHFLCFHAM